MDQPSAKKLATLCLLLTSLALTGCGGATGILFASDSAYTLLRGLSREEINRDAVSAIPYASMELRFNNTNHALLILGYQTEGYDHWGLADAFVTLRGARVVRTVGLTHNITASDISDADPVIQGRLLQIPDGYTFTSRLDAEPGYLYRLDCQSRFHREARETITILGYSYDTTPVVEERTCNGWRHENRFWVADNGFVWKSEQFLHPDTGALRLAITRPPVGNF